MGAALMRLGMRDRAIQAYETCLTLQPPLRAAHRVLAGIPPDANRAAFHLRASREFAAHRKNELRRIETIRQEARHRAIDREALRSENAAARPQPETGPALELILVSGLPRSGTSLMMQLLAAGGLVLMADGERLADADNPEGYHEWERIKQVGRKPEVLREAAGRVIKVVAPLPAQLSVLHSYKVIYMDRPIDEVAQSQRRMIRNRGNEGCGGPGKMRQILSDFRDSTIRMLQRRKQFTVLIVDYPELVRDPGPWLPRIAAFLDRRADTAAMAAAIRPDLHRNRA